MPGLDDRIERALRESARAPDADPGMVARGVERKKVRRQARRNAATGALVAAVLVTTAVVTVAIVRRDGGEDRRVSTPPSTTAAQPADPVAAQTEIAAVVPGPEISPPEYLSDTEAMVDMESARGVRVEYVDGSWQIDPASVCRIEESASCGAPDVRVSDGAVTLGSDAYGGAAAPLEPVQQPAQEYVRGPVVSVGDASWVTVYERDGSTWNLPSQLLDLTSGRRINLQGEILSFAAGEDGTLWAVTHDEIVDTDGTEFRLKRIPRGGGPVSTPLPPELVPAGRIAVGPDAVYVPMRDAVLQFSTEGAAAGSQTEVEFPEQDQREVAVLNNGSVVATDGASLRQVNPAAGVPGAPLVDGPGAPLTDVVVSVNHVWALTGDELVRLDTEAVDIQARSPLPPGLTAASLTAIDDRVLVTGFADLAEGGDPNTPSAAVEPIALIVGSSGAESTVVLAGAGDTAVSLEPSGDLLLTSNGNLYRADLP